MTLNEYLIKKANPFHAADGRFTSASGRGSSKAVYVSTGDKFKTALDNAKELKKNRDRDSRDLKREKRSYLFQKDNKSQIEKTRDLFANNWQEKLDDKEFDVGKQVDLINLRGWTSRDPKDRNLDVYGNNKKSPGSGGGRGLNVTGEITEVNRLKDGSLKSIILTRDGHRTRYNKKDLEQVGVAFKDNEKLKLYGNKSNYNYDKLDSSENFADKQIERYKQLRKQRLESKRNKSQKSELLSTLATIYRVKKANPYKDESGKWTSKDKAKTIAEWFYEGGKEQIKRTSAGLAGAAVGGLAGAGAGSLVGSGLAAAGSSYLTGAASGLTSIPLLGESLSGLAKASAPTAAGIATGAALGSMAGLGVLGIGAGAYLGAKTAGAAVGGYLGAKGGYEVGTALYDSNLSEKIEEWKSNAKDKASAQTDKLKDTVKARVGDLKNKASKEFDAAKQKTHAAIESKAAQAKELIKQKANEAKNKAKAAATSKLKELTTRYKPIKKYDLTALRNA